MSAPATEPVEPLALAAEFPAANRDDWRALVSAVLAKSGVAADADPEGALAATTYDGIPIKPLYTAADAPAVSTAPADRWAGWDVRQRQADPDAARANAAILADLAGGATSVWLAIGDGGTAVADLDRALDGVYLDLAPVALDAGADTAGAARAYLDLAGARGVGLAELHGSLGADPIGLRARTGAAADLALLGDLAQLAAATPLRIAAVDGTVYHDAGASDADEVGISAAVGVAYLRALVDGGMSVADALARIEFRYAVTADQFASIAKLRAARRIWARVAQLCGAESAAQYQHAVTSWAMLTQRDPWVNMLRTTIACFAAAVGGAEAITVLPFDAALGLPDDLGRRIARNTHAVLHDESSLARVVDPAGGSFYVESLTDQLAHRAWEIFTTIEKQGGALATLDSGAIEQLIEIARVKRADDIAHRRAPLTGVSEFAYVGEAPVTRAPAAPRPSGGPLAPHRWAEPFEQLRDRSDAAPHRPQVFLAALGPISAHSARAGFAANLLQAAGVEPVTGTGTVDEIVAAFREAGTPVACLCSSDKVYVEQAGDAAGALRAAGASMIMLAGKPPRGGGYAGVDSYVFTGVNAVDVLTATLDELGVA